jgi:hypothetical protein
MVPEATDDPFRIAYLVSRAFAGLGVPHFVSGSVASAILGEPRTTLDIDVVADLPLARVDSLVAELDANFFVDPRAVRQAVQRRDSFNVVHRGSGWKVDVMIAKTDPFAREELRRARPVVVAGDPDVTLPFVTREDLILAKLRWYEMGGQVSDRQWRDVLGLLKHAGPQLDTGHLRSWAAQLKLTVLLERALRESGLA